MAGMLVDHPGTHAWGGGGVVKVVSLETRGQLDAGWLAATRLYFCSIQMRSKKNKEITSHRYASH